MAAGLILAAGGSARFGAGPKQLADLAGRPLLQWAVDAQCAVAVEILSPVVVVLGAHAREIGPAVDFGRAEVVVCERWRDGQGASLRRGLRVLADAGSIVVTLGDAPLLTPDVIAQFALAPPGSRATYRGRPGHPVVLGPEQRARLGQLDGDRGARGVLDGGRMIEVGDRCSGRDVDTLEDLEDIRATLTG